MKKLILAWALFSVISCGGSDEDQDPGNKASIIGKWSVEKAEIYKSSNQQILTSYSTDCQKTALMNLPLLILFPFPMPITITPA